MYTLHRHSLIKTHSDLCLAYSEYNETKTKTKTKTILNYQIHFSEICCYKSITTVCSLALFTKCCRATDALWRLISAYAGDGG